MTVCVVEAAAEDEDDPSPPPGCVIAVDGAYAARLARSGDSWFPERWTLDGPEPYAVPLPGNQPEEPGTEVQPMGDGRVLIRRLAAGRHTFSLLYPTGPGTGELPLGAVECPGPGIRLRLLPPAPGGARAYALAVGGTPAPCGWWRAARSGRSASPRSPGAARAGCGWTGRGGCWPWTGSPAGGPRRWWWTSGAAGRCRRCSRSPPAATTGCCSPTPTAGCC
ncbi:hypothetical protein GCM10020295_59390 [Streptomyces cinereospinus]